MANAKNVHVATTANISFGIPEPAFTAINAVDSALTGAIATGLYTGDEGIEVSNERDTTDITAHQNSALVRVITTGSRATYHFVFLENSPAVRQLWFGSAETSGKINFAPGQSYRGNFVIDAIDAGINGQTSIIRHKIADAEVTSVDTLTYSNSDATRYAVTITAYVSGTNGRVAEVFSEVDTV